MNNFSYKKKKTRWQAAPSMRLALRLLSVLALFSISRWLIYPFNLEFFHHLTQWQALRLYFIGMRFDLVVIAYANLPLILFYCLPSQVIFNKVLQKIVDVIFILCNSVLILANMMDVIYFRFLGHRSTSMFFLSLGDRGGDVAPVLWQVVADYWYMLVLALLFILLLVVATTQTQLKKEDEMPASQWKSRQWVSLLVMAVLTPIACRGGLQKHPVSLATALRYTDSQNIPIVLNAPFNIAKSPREYVLSKLQSYEPGEMEFSPVHLGLHTSRFFTDSLAYRPNVVILVLESVGQEMITYYNPQRRYPLTPFLDSLLTQSLTFNGRANGRRSMEALPAMLSGLPSLMGTDFLLSPYADNTVDGLGHRLKSVGYHTSMFHGGNNDRMDFSKYSQRTGFDYYFGRNEYSHRFNGESVRETDYDGRLGIFDGPFLQFTLDHLNTFTQPFATVVHTLSSHYPYTMPKGFKMPQESYLWSGFEKTVYYSDCALRDFFEEASKQAWFDSTLFVITANHANYEHYLPEYSNVWGMYSVPIAFYMPSRLPGHRCQEVAQHTDLNLSVLSALGVNDTVFSFGRNLFDTLGEPFGVAFINQTYQYSNGLYLVQSDGEQTIGVFNIQRDRRLEDNLIDRIQCADLAKKLRELVQEYNNRFIDNQLYIDKQALHEQEEDTIYHQPDLWPGSPEELAEPN